MDIPGNRAARMADLYVTVERTRIALEATMGRVEVPSTVNDYKQASQQLIEAGRELFNELNTAEDRKSTPESVYAHAAAAGMIQVDQRIGVKIAEFTQQASGLWLCQFDPAPANVWVKSILFRVVPREDDAMVVPPKVHAVTVAGLTSAPMDEVGIPVDLYPSEPGLPRTFRVDIPCVAAGTRPAANSIARLLLTGQTVTVLFGPSSGMTDGALEAVLIGDQLDPSMTQRLWERVLLSAALAEAPTTESAAP